MSDELLNRVPKTKQQTESVHVEPVVMLPWVKIDKADDVRCDHEVLLWDGFDWHLDYVEYDEEMGAHFFSNGTEATHYMLITPPDE